MQRSRIILIVSILAALAVGFGAGFGYVKRQEASAVDPIVKQVINQDEGRSSAVDFSLFWQVWDRLHARYVDANALDTQKLVYGAISGMVAAAGDPYTTFFEPELNKKFQEEVSGAFSGVGMELGKRDSNLVVISPIKDSPAMRAGIRAGDIILTVDGTPVDGWSVEEAVSRIRGKKGTSVTLTMAREGATDVLTFTLVRDTIRVPAVDWRRLDDGTAYLQIMSFNANVDDEFSRAARDIAASGAQRMIIDLRNNPGGLLDSAVNIAGWLLKPESTVVQERFSDGLSQYLRANGNARLASLPTVVIMNGGSASAAEILAGALHDVRSVPLVGETSFGKGSVQQLEEFYNGSSLKVTVAKWFTPNGVSISDSGIAPSVKVTMDPKQFEANGWQIGTPGKDPQLDRALEIVRGLK
ncbi:MAG: S41 family peptidase [Candidatus Yanofskybacteria bacterium]|nr:S41 family peptidase [Candidatus Yanofskybacteria bacterium]